MLIDTTAFEPATPEQLDALRHLAILLNIKPISCHLTKCEAASCIAAWFTTSSPRVVSKIK